MTHFLNSSESSSHNINNQSKSKKKKTYFKGIKDSSIALLGADAGFMQDGKKKLIFSRNF